MTPNPKPRFSPTAAHLFFEGIQGEVRAALEATEQAQAVWQASPAWRLIPGDASTPTNEVNARALSAGLCLAGAVEHLRQLDKALTAMRATIPAVDPEAVPA